MTPLAASLLLELAQLVLRCRSLPAPPPARRETHNASRGGALASVVMTAPTPTPHSSALAPGAAAPTDRTASAPGAAAEAVPTSAAADATSRTSPAPAPAPAPAPSSAPEAAPSERTTVRRLPDRGSYDSDLAYALLDEGFVAHVGLATDDGPVVIPMLYARDGDRLLLHGSAASRLLRTAGSGVELCVTVTLVDGLVLARSAFHHSANYRSVVVFGRATKLDDLAERRAAMDTLVEGIVPGRTTDPHPPRPPSDKELRGTIVLALPLDELSIKVRQGGPIDEPEDYAVPVWAGIIPLTLTPGTPIPDPSSPKEAPTVADLPPTPACARNYRRPAGP